MEPLADPLHDRVVTSVQPPPAQPLKHSLLYPSGPANPPNWQELKSHLQREGRLSKEDCLELIKNVTEITSNEPNLLRLNDPITVVGDIHGQFYDLLKLLDVGGDPDTTQYLFLGDYVDRGSFSIEVLLLLYAIKLNHPTRVWLLRGNHECRQMTSFFNFRDECECKYDMTVYFAFMEAFDSLPLAAVINGKFLALHGGLSPELKVLSQIGGVNRFQEPPRGGLFCDLLWADPLDESKDDVGQSPEDSFTPNDVRGCSFFFGYSAASKFLDRNGLLSVLRAHEAQLEGYKMHQTNQKTGFPTVITIFSAPNYCDVYNNKGAVLKFENNTLNIQQFNFSPHPYHLPNFMDVFTWSIPFVSEKVTEMLYGILNPSIDDDEDDEDVDDVELPPAVLSIMKAHLPSDEASGQRHPPAGDNRLSKERADALRKKVQSVGRLMRVFKTLRQENELIVRLKGCTPGHRIPVGLLLQGREGIANELDKFENAKQIDLMNERRPDGGSSSR
ncbi:protein phosphatase 2B catalytic subunit, calcineurin family phosphatse superfamily protein [Toxoplasma gondii TgCatPRC2]|uniref:Serine/threonine-protein phosphatase n=14 Tax=Toxoplasma gondii TaxID=5811 RepID=V4ZIA1_TOXGV|nr:protein phosphatase 2B catalytic subunit, calcineurin family phosphatse superfamily protein [Toxoplasma gondii ME49]AAM97278.1 protein phosphatase 2B catalytic subunit [Toxoplasma gondii]EPR61119.1 protein phosphatase 2B catalytic subunit, calcineurin family phosphatse superfamily protein [Toxoplasma gondii GT1]ESS34898.1 protein phosphatase 2B catalytic subunit, calcineurin family phosphatse superfamily protein [Toxoplasma gondii VEG]KFG28693.1 protein phosphatase 2B catalytic subunit, calc|eukprot:XP_018635527.1 protein phosphatase 2B catalytic subunit, calcineurin family phosphatse superfamily protein [Toxoplasma gondii ME49]